MPPGIPPRIPDTLLDIYVSRTGTRPLYLTLENHSTGEVQYTRLKKQKNNAKTKMVASVSFVGIPEGHG